MQKALRYFHTLRFLKPVQIYGRLRHVLYRPKIDLRLPPDIRPSAGEWIAPAMKAASLISPCRFRLLNEEHDILSASDWNRSDWSKLWLYHLHYFDDLNAENATDRLDWHRVLLARWVTENKPGIGNGWEPYPLSLRIVNWIKWVLKGNTLPSSAMQSLAIQVRFLRARMEYHLLGNHLIANVKALIFAGFFFKGPEAEAWLDKGLKVLADEIHVQVLDDGGHFEQSPMYHSIVLEDFLDLINLFKCYAAFSLNAQVTAATNKMITWLKVMCHPDQQIALINDAALDIAPNPSELYAYGKRLGIEQPVVPASPQMRPDRSSIEILSFGNIQVTHLKSSGYIRVENGPCIAILDVGPVGPDYLPGHAHADTLTFEMSLGVQRVVVDSGTSLYGESKARLRQRGTAAHNTVMINGKDSSEVWGGFRVARRAKPFGLEIKETPSGGVCIRCAHDGYRHHFGKPVHWREWYFEEHFLAVRDVIEGKFSEAIGCFHFYPGLGFDGDGSHFNILLPSGRKLYCRIKEGGSRFVRTSYHPSFGVGYENQCLKVQLQNNASQIVFKWQ